MRLRIQSIVAFTSLFHLSCGGNILPRETSSFQSPPHSGDALPENPEFNGSLSDRGNVKFKRQIVLEADIAATLDLPKENLCNEFGTFSCINEIHHLALGGVDAYANNIYDANLEPIATTPVILERIVISACSSRAIKDLENSSSAVIFKNMTSADVSTEILKENITTLYQRALLRNPQDPEMDQLVSLYDDLKSRQVPDVGKRWAQLACYSVLTSVEYMFY